MKNKLIYIIFLLITLFVLILILNNNNQTIEKNYFYFDTYINIKINTTKNIDNLLEDIENTLKDYHELTDKYNSYDNVINIYYLNEILPNNTKIEIDERLSYLIIRGYECYNETSGYINIASSNLIDVWKKYIEEKTGVPSLDELQVNIDINDMSLEDNIYIKQNNIKLDLGSYVKGFVTDEIARILDENGIKDYIIDAGGNIKVGNKTNNNKYNIGIIDPVNTDSIFEKIEVENVSVVTSGDYQRYYEYDGIRYSHIINPYTLYPSSIYKSVTVIYPSSFIADIYSTYLFMLDIDEAKEVVSKIDDMKVIWYIDEDNIIYSYK